MSKSFIIFCLILGIIESVHSAKLVTVQQSSTADKLMIQPSYELTISDKVIEAINNGIVITFVMQTKLYQEVNWWLDRSTTYHIKTFQVRYFSLTGLYQLHDTRSDEKLSFVQLDDLLKHLGNEVVFEFKLEPPADYFETRIFLDKQALPSIMQLPNVFDSDWNFNSGWQKIEIDTSQSPSP